MDHLENGLNIGDTREDEFNIKRSSKGDKIFLNLIGPHHSRPGLHNLLQLLRRWDSLVWSEDQETFVQRVRKGRDGAREVSDRHHASQGIESESKASGA